MDFNEFSISTYVINLKKRPDRLKSIREQFKGRPEFDLTIVEAIENPVGNVGLWESICKAVALAIKNDEDVILICEDDHHFTSNYNPDTFFKSIINGHKMKCDLLTGGIGGFGKADIRTENLFEIDWFWCTQFIVIYKHFFNVILNTQFKQTDTVDGKISEIGNIKMVCYPFISVQKDFGYSDVTLNNNNNKNLINNHFIETIEKFENLFESLQRPKGNFEFDNNIHRSADAEAIVPLIYKMIKPDSVVDFGCGLGHFLGEFKKYGIKHILGIDGNVVNFDKVCINSSELIIRDLEEPIVLKQRYDLALCLEVAEHLPFAAADILVNSLVDSSDLILFSAAIPGQGGLNHINEQWVEYWMDKFKKYSYTFYDVIRNQIWNEPHIHWWYKQNIFLVIKDGYRHSFTYSPILNMIHPDHYSQKVGCTPPKKVNQ